jgi:uncharacterized C2H2 Zn-finger protein
MLSGGAALRSSLKQRSLSYKYTPCFVKLTNISSICAQLTFSCPNCNKVFTLERNLIRHMKNLGNICTGQAVKQTSIQPVDTRKYKCDICNTTFSYKNSLIKHQNKGSCSNVKFTRKNKAQKKENVEEDVDKNNNDSFAFDSETEQTLSSSASSIISPEGAVVSFSSSLGDIFPSSDLFCPDFPEIDPLMSSIMWVMITLLVRWMHQSKLKL